MRVHLDAVTVGIDALEADQIGLVDEFEDGDRVDEQLLVQAVHLVCRRHVKAKVVKGAWVRRVLAFHERQIEAVGITQKEDLALPGRASIEPKVRFIKTSRAPNVVDQQRQVLQNRRHWRPSRSTKASAQAGPQVPAG